MEGDIGRSFLMETWDESIVTLPALRDDKPSQLVPTEYHSFYVEGEGQHQHFKQCFAQLLSLRANVRVARDGTK